MHDCLQVRAHPRVYRSHTTCVQLYQIHVGPKPISFLFSQIPENVPVGGRLDLSFENNGWKCRAVWPAGLQSCPQRRNEGAGITPNVRAATGSGATSQCASSGLPRDAAAGGVFVRAGVDAREDVGGVFVRAGVDAREDVGGVFVRAGVDAREDVGGVFVRAGVDAREDVGFHFEVVFLMWL